MHHLWIVLIGLSVVATPAAGQPSSAVEDTIKQVFDAARSIQHMEAQFTQIKELQAFKEPVTSTGTLVYDRDGKVVWSYQTPARMNFELAGSMARIIYPDLGEEQEFNLEADERFRPMVESMFVWLNGDLSTVTESYEMGAGPDPQTLQMSPRDELVKGFVQRIVLHYEEGLQVDEVRIYEPDGDSTIIHFTYTNVERTPDP